MARPIDIIGRVLAALLGGYALSYAVSGALALLLPVPRPDAVYISGMLAYLPMTFAVLWAFAARTALRAWAWLLALAAPPAAVLLLGWPRP
ncbi:iron transporter [Roseicella frigidaeris]|uniref:Iron transporter n=1 Tax=Roseicella frigidaeris TaxID=2230885 RepID=A0A327MDI7_9PROT|nr:iron transporter [Roseicella frigidaeris]RAI60719.1 iron transporter [Roseicella frigidaeris]